jgi:signal transduction histidine kinase
MEQIPTRLQEVVAEAVEVMAPEFRKRGQTFDVEVDEPALWVMGDKVRLVQVLGNLLHNACKFTPAGGQVRLVLVRDGAHGQLRVSDTGCGIVPTELQRVFGLFEQGEDAATPGHGGLGIGLNLVHQVVQRHGGEVSAFSTGEPGKGAEFVVCLPLVDAPADDGTP